jgi:RNA polymerase-interacting CarD/CdnL/TRCF family regulator
MNKLTVSFEENLGILENKIYDSQLEIEWLSKEVAHIKDPASLHEAEQQIVEATNRLAARILALKIQESLNRNEIRAEERKVIRSVPKKMKNQGVREVKISTSFGVMITVVASYFSRATKKDKRRKKRNGIYPGLFLQGIHDRLTPKLASEISSIAVIVGSYAEARQVMKGNGIFLDIKKICNTCRRYAQRAKLSARTEGYNFSETLSGCRVVVSVDGGRVRIREKKRGPKTKKGRSGYHGAWREPKLLIIHTVNAQGKADKTFAPFIDASMKGPDAVFSLLRFYLEKINVSEAAKVLFVADGARWIWNRVGNLFASLGLASNQCHELLDFYHAAEHLNKIAGLQRKLKPAQRKRWFAKHRTMLKNGGSQEVVEAIKELYRRSRNKKLRTERDYFVRNMNRMLYSDVAEKSLPIGSGSVESAIRRVVNLRLKGASLFWLKETAEAMLYLRAHYKAGRWNMLREHVFSLKAASVV